jgi:hypothetical protein
MTLVDEDEFKEYLRFYLTSRKKRLKYTQKEFETINLEDLAG